jgi:hypothetical protein
MGTLAGKDDGLLVAPVVGIDVFGDLGLEEQVLGEGVGAALDIAGGRGLVARGDIAEVALLVDEQFLVREDDEGRIDGSVPVGMVLHAVPDHVGDLVEFAVVHLEEGVEDAPLHGLEPVLEVGYRPVLDDVGGVVEVVLVEDLLYVGQ